MKRLHMQLFLAFAIVMLVALALPVLYGRQTMHRELLDDMSTQTLRQAVTLSDVLDARPQLSGQALQQYFMDVAEKTNIRITFIDHNGVVLADSSQNFTALDQLGAHGNRPEIANAKHNGTGTAVRYSDTLGLDLVYAAVAVPAPEPGQTELNSPEPTESAASLDNARPAGVLRVAVPFAGIAGRVDTLAWRLALGALVAVLLAFWLSQRILGRLSTAIDDMVEVVENTGHSLSSRRPALPPRAEFYRLNAAVSEMTDRIEQKLRTIEAQKAELETILDLMTEGVLVLDARGRIHRANPALFRLFPNIDAPIDGKLPVEVLPVPALQNALHELLHTEQLETEQRACSLQMECGRMVFAVHISQPRFSQTGGTSEIGAVVVVHDISEMAQLIRMKRDLVANVSHELRTPITAIQGYAETLAELENTSADKPNANADNAAQAIETRKKFLAVIRKHTAHMARLVEDLLTLSRLEQGENLGDGSTKICLALNDAVEECQSLAQQRQLSFQVSCPDNLPAAGDRDRQSQIWRNLLENACRYAYEGTPIWVRVAVVTAQPSSGEKPGPNAGENTAETPMIQCTVQDFGPGLPKAELGHIFERFYRVEKHRGGGTGLGLAICKHMVERLGGHIWAEYNAAPLSTQDEAFSLPPDRPVGATFHFTLPLAGQGVL